MPQIDKGVEEDDQNKGEEASDLEQLIHVSMACIIGGDVRKVRPVYP